MNGHKNQTLYNKIWSNVALGNLKEAIKLTWNKGRLGMDDEKVAEGFKLTQIRQNSPAWNNHLKIGDILTSFNDIPLNNISDDSLVNIINASPRGTRVNISIIRDNIKQTGFITMGIIDSSYATSISK
jgi:S1-C subfamily serine protease